MSLFKVVYIDSIVTDSKTPTIEKHGDDYFTYGWGGRSAREFKKYNPQIEVERWRTDTKSKDILVKEVAGVVFRVFPGYHIKYFGVFAPSLLKHLKAVINTCEKTVFNISGFRHLLFYNVASKLSDHPFVVQHNGEVTAIYKTHISKGIKKIFYQLHLHYEKKTFKNTDLLYVLDERIKPYLPSTIKIKQQTLGIITERFPVIPKMEARRLLGLDQNKKYIIYVGRLNVSKRSDILIDVFKEIRKERDDIELILAGVFETDRYYSEAKETGAKIYGTIQHTEIYKYLAASDVYVLPKYYKEDIFGGIGLLPLESLLSNTPVVGESLLNFPEPDRGNVGFAVNTSDKIKEAILKIVDNEVTFTDIRDKAIKYYSWQRIIEKTFNDYKEIITKYYG
jgi:glycosyltransferase involved in cell wall biosynthesis